MTKFCDEVKITIIAGKGGAGAVSFRREKFIPFGGPDGGNGGQGADVIFRANPNLNTLADYLNKKVHKAENGQGGAGKNMQGASGTPLVLEVPPGTLIYDSETNELLADLRSPNMDFVAAHGGIGGKGNANFVSSTRQAPRFAEKGELGEEKNLRLELQLIADIGIIGYPSVGKSTLISVVSAAKPRIADYEFTTLIPNLGVVKIEQGKSFVVCDIPGLIKGASEGRGLGHEFLRHVQRCRLLVHLLDPLRPEGIVKNWQTINTELKKFDSTLAQKPQITVINKIDTLPLDQLQKLKTKLKKTGAPDLHAISAATHSGTTELIHHLYQLLEKIPKEQKITPASESMPIIRPHLTDPKRYTVSKEKENEYRITGIRFEQIVRMTPLENPEGLARVVDVMHKLGITRQLKKLGAQPGDPIHIGTSTIDFIDWKN